MGAAGVACCGGEVALGRWRWGGAVSAGAGGMGVRCRDAPGAEGCPAQEGGGMQGRAKGLICCETVVCKNRGKIGEGKGFFLKKWLYFCIVKEGTQTPSRCEGCPNKQTKTNNN